MKEVEIYTDGACSGNPGPGGWAAVLLHKDHRKEIFGYDAATTNNRMELLAPIRALEALKEPCIVDVYSDSAYLVNAFRQGWLESWKKNNWRKSDKKPVENQDLWKELVILSERHRISWHKVKGHSDNVENNRCDELATQQIKLNAK